MIYIRVLTDCIEKGHVPDVADDIVYDNLLLLPESASVAVT